MANPPTDLLRLQSDIHRLLTHLDTRAARAPTHSTDKGPLTTAAWHLSRAHDSLDRLFAAYRKED